MLRKRKTENNPSPLEPFCSTYFTDSVQQFYQSGSTSHHPLLLLNTSSKLYNLILSQYRCILCSAHQCAGSASLAAKALVLNSKQPPKGWKQHGTPLRLMWVAEMSEILKSKFKNYRNWKLSSSAKSLLFADLLNGWQLKLPSIKLRT